MGEVSQVKRIKKKLLDKLVLIDPDHNAAIEKILQDQEPKQEQSIPGLFVKLKPDIEVLIDKKIEEAKGGY